MSKWLSGRPSAGSLFVVCGFALLLVAPGAFSQGESQAGGLPGLERRVALMESKIGQLEQENEELWAAIGELEAALAQEVADRTAGDAALDARADALEDKTQFMSVMGTDTLFIGTNIVLQNGLGSTNGNPGDPSSTSDAQVNGLGNLMIGYNASFGGPRSGSHNLVMGDYNDHTSFGAILAGRDNASTAPYASVLGGRSNDATAAWAVVLGGAFGLADGHTSSIVGGNANRTSAIDAVVCGGNFNHASARFATVGGGSGVEQATEFGWSAGSFGAAVGGSFRSP